MRSVRQISWPGLVGAIVVLGLGAGHAFAVDFTGIQTGALDQPRAFMMIRENGVPLDALQEDFWTGQMVTTYTIEGYLDTGASTILLAAFNVPESTGFGIPLQPGWIFEDVGVGGAEQFDVTGDVTFHLAPYTPVTDIDNPATFDTVYNQSFGPGGAVTGTSDDPTPGAPVDPLDEILALLGQVNVFGMPVMQHKTVVMDARPVNQFIYENNNGLPITSTGTLNTFIYNPDTPFNPATDDTDPGIPVTDLHIQTTEVDFSDYVQTLNAPPGEGPAFTTNPFIGPNPLTAGAQSGGERGVLIGNGGQTAEGSVLFDTGAAVSMVSTGMAGQLDVRYKPGFEPDPENDAPMLQKFDNGQWVDLPAIDQFELSVTGVGGTIMIAGTWFDSYRVPTIEGETNPQLDIVYNDVPLLVFDISTKNPNTQEVYTLDGIFGMNLLFGTAFVDEPIDLFALLGTLTPGAYDWVTFDEPTGRIGLTVDHDLFAAGDTDFDEDVDITDFNNLATNFDPGGVNAANNWLRGNFDADNDVDITDFNNLATNFAPGGYDAAAADADPGTVDLIVDLATGEVSLEGNAAAISGLQIFSAGDSLLASDFVADVLQFVISTNASTYAEGAFIDTAVDGVISLGALYDLLVNAQDLAFEYTMIGQPTVQGTVIYIPEPATMLVLGLGGFVLIRRPMQRG